MRAVQPPPAADDDSRADEAGRVIDLPAGALSSGRRPRARTGRTARPPRPTAAADLGAALNASLADLSVAAERLADSGGVVPPAAPRPSRPARTRPSPSAGAAAPAPQRRPRAVPRPPAWEPVPWAEASAASKRPIRSARSTQSDRPGSPPHPEHPDPASQPPAASPAARASAAAASRTAIATVPFPTSPPRDVEPEPRLWGIDAPPPDAAGTELVRTVPGWALAVMVVIVAVVACLAGYLLLRP
jgi:hypothetical protein